MSLGEIQAGIVGAIALAGVVAKVGINAYVQVVKELAEARGAIGEIGRQTQNNTSALQGHDAQLTDLALKIPTPNVTVTAGTGSVQFPVVDPNTGQVAS